ncbi:hypothetical protein V8D89_000973 [Ganoderma adspersum]
MPSFDADTTLTTVVTSTVFPGDSPVTVTFPPPASVFSAIVCGLDGSGNKGSPWTSFGLGAPPFGLPKPPCDAVSTPASTSTSTATAPPLIQSTPAHSDTPASGLSTGSAVGIAFAVFMACGILVAAALLLLLRKRRRRWNRGYSCAKQQRAPSAAYDSGASSRPLSSTWSWSWFGSLPVASEPDLEHKYGTRSRWPTPMARSPPVHGEHDPQPKSEDGAAQPPLPPAKIEYSSSILPSYPSAAAPRGVDGPDSRSRDMQDAGRSRPHDSFADPRVSGISSKSRGASVAEVASMEAP